MYLRLYGCDTFYSMADVLVTVQFRVLVAMPGVAWVQPEATGNCDIMLRFLPRCVALYTIAIVRVP